MPRLTVAELIEQLKKFPPTAYWNGWDDESIIIYVGEEDGSNRKELGWIEPSGDVRIRNVES